MSKERGGCFETEAYSAFDGQVLAAIDRRAYGNEVFMSRFRAHCLQSHTCKRIHELVGCEFVSRYQLIRIKTQSVK
jgi:hypothetical protein